jgi:LysR family nitrogen assimilation transcriptional regulator
VAIGLPPSLSRVLAVPLTRAFRQQLPQASVSICEGLSVNMQEWLATGRLDIAVLYNAQPSPDIELAPLHEEDLVLVQPRPAGLAPHLADEAAAPIRLRDVAEVPLVIPSRPNAIRMLVETELANLGCRPTVALEIDGVAAMLDLVADGAGASLLSRHAVTSSIRPSAYQVRPIIDPPLRTRLSLAVSAQRPATLTQQATLALLRATALASLPSP